MIGFSQWASCKILITQTIEIIHEACVNNDMIEAMLFPCTCLPLIFSFVNKKQTDR